MGASSFDLLPLVSNPKATLPMVWWRRVLGGLGLVPPPPECTWAFLLGSTKGRLWLGRLLVTVRPRWTMRNQFCVGTNVGTLDQE